MTNAECRMTNDSIAVIRYIVTSTQRNRSDDGVCLVSARVSAHGMTAGNGFVTKVQLTSERKGKK